MSNCVIFYCTVCLSYQTVLEYVNAAVMLVNRYCIYGRYDAYHVQPICSISPIIRNELWAFISILIDWDLFEIYIFKLCQMTQNTTIQLLYICAAYKYICRFDIAFIIVLYILCLSTTFVKGQIHQKNYNKPLKNIIKINKNIVINVV